MGETRTMTETANRELQDVVEINHYTGGEKCQYDCDEIAEFVVKGMSSNGGVTFIGCRDCLNDALIRPIDNGWVDERTDKERNR